MAELKYEIGVDYPYFGVIPNIPLGAWVEIIWVCGTRMPMKHTEGNKACWHPRIYDPAIESFCVTKYPAGFEEAAKRQGGDV